MSRALLAVLGGMLLRGHETAFAAGPPGPQLVSPGSTAGSAAGQGSCPTFSWASLLRGSSQELVVYEVDESGIVAAEPVLSQRLPSLASSWTPSASECLRRGKSYVWSVRWVGDSEPSEWAEARFFSVPAAPSDAELQAALEVLRAHYAATQGEPLIQPLPLGTSETPLAQARPSGESDVPPDSPVRTARAGAVASFRVGAGGAVEATSFAGDGSDLYNIGSAAIVAGAVGSSEIATSAVGTTEIAADAVGAGEIAAGAVGSSEIAAGAVGASEIATDAVGPTEIAGNFCLVRRGDYPCPSGYTQYILAWDTEDTANGDVCTEEVAFVCDSDQFSKLSLAFCCA